MASGYLQDTRVVAAGKSLAEARKVLILLHGRGATAESILPVAGYLQVADFALLAPEAPGNTWYPYSFLEPRSRNEPALSTALAILSEIVNTVNAAGIPSENIYFLGFSQGASLTLEFTARHARQYGGIVAFTGGLAGNRINAADYSGSFGGTPVFIGTGDPDPHVPVARVNETAEIFSNLHARVTKKIYKDLGHTISQDELDRANALVFNSGNHSLYENK